MILVPGAGMTLLQQAAVLPGDTLYTVQVAAERGWFEILTGAASIAISLALLALAVGLIPAAWNFRKSYQKANDLLDRVYADVTPLVRHAHTVADNLDYITTSVRTDLQRVSRTINTANERLLGAVEESEARLAEFNALLKVMQEEAEDVFVSTASTVRGVQEGASALGDSLSSREAALLRRRLEARLARLETLAADEAEDAASDEHELDDHDREVDDDGDWDGDDFDDGRLDIRVERTDAAEERPRIRRRSRDLG